MWYIHLEVETMSFFAVCLFSFVLTMFIFWTVQINKERNEAIKNGKITKEDLEKEREDMNIW